MAPNNTLTCWGNEKTMNLNSLILTNIQSSPYFKCNLYELKTYHEVVDEIYLKVSHLEPWEKGSRKTAGQTGMCGGVRGVGAGGIVSSAYCLLYKLFTLKLTRKQLKGLLEHADSPYIRGLGFMYIRYSQDPKELWEWYEPYFEDDEEIDVKAGGGSVMTIGEMIKQWLTKLEWYSTLFPRIPVPVQKDIDLKIRAMNAAKAPPPPPPARHIADDEVNFGEAERYASNAATRKRSPTPPHRSRHRAPWRGSPSRRSPAGRSPPRRSPPRRSPPRRSPPRRSPPRRSPPRRSSASRSPTRYRSPPRRRSPPRHRSPPRRSPPRHRHSPPRQRRSRSPRRGNSPIDYARELQRERDRQHRERQKSRSRSRSREGKHPREQKRSVSPQPKHKSSKHRSGSKTRDKGSKKHRSRSRSPHEKKSKHRRSGSPRERKKHKHRRRSHSVERNGH